MKSCIGGRGVCIHCCFSKPGGWENEAVALFPHPPVALELEAKQAHTQWSQFQDPERSALVPLIQLLAVHNRHYDQRRILLLRKRQPQSRDIVVQVPGSKSGATSKLANLDLDMKSGNPQGGGGLCSLPLMPKQTRGLSHSGQQNLRRS